MDNNNNVHLKGKENNAKPENTEDSPLGNAFDAFEKSEAEGTTTPPTDPASGMTGGTDGGPTDTTPENTTTDSGPPTGDAQPNTSGSSSTAPNSDPASNSGGCTVPANSQCGGASWTGCTTCVEGMQCFSFNEHWSDCKPPGFAGMRIMRRTD